MGVKETRLSVVLRMRLAVSTFPRHFMVRLRLCSALARDLLESSYTSAILLESASRPSRPCGPSCPSALSFFALCSQPSFALTGAPVLVGGERLVGDVGRGVSDDDVLDELLSGVVLAETDEEDFAVTDEVFAATGGVSELFSEIFVVGGVLTGELVQTSLLTFVLV